MKTCQGSIEEGSIEEVPIEKVSSTSIPRVSVQEDSIEVVPIEKGSTDIPPVLVVGDSIEEIPIEKASTHTEPDSIKESTIEEVPIEKESTDTPPDPVKETSIEEVPIEKESTDSQPDPVKEGSIEEGSADTPPGSVKDCSFEEGSIDKVPIETESTDTPPDSVKDVSIEESSMSDTEEESSGSESQWPVNETWLRGLLQRNHPAEADNINILDFSVKAACQNGVSNLSDLLAVSVLYELSTDGTKRCIDLIVKLLPHDPFSRYFVTEAQFDLREIKFYTTILPDLLAFQTAHLQPGATPMTVSVPKCFHTQYTAGTLPTKEDASPEAPESMLVLEDMRPLGYRAAHFKQGLTLAEAESAIATIAVVHALSLAIKVKEKVDLNERYPFLFQVSRATESYQQLVEQGLPQLSRFLDGLDSHREELEALMAIRHRTRSIIEQLLQPTEPMGLITHTDFWCNNLLLRETIETGQPDNCVILDWQMVTHSRPTNDVALLCISSLSAEVRREATGGLLDLYYGELKGNLARVGVELEGELGYSREQLERDYKKSQLLALLLCIGSVDIALGNDEAEQRFLDVLHDLHAEGVLNVGAETS